jgi:hypothetical protein
MKHVAALSPAPGRIDLVLASPPAATAWAPDQLEVFAVFDDGELWDRFWDGETWHPWESLGGKLALGPSPAALFLGS